MSPKGLEWKDGWEGLAISQNEENGQRTEKNSKGKKGLFKFSVRKNG